MFRVARRIRGSQAEDVHLIEVGSGFDFTTDFRRHFEMGHKSRTQRSLPISRQNRAHTYFCISVKTGTIDTNLSPYGFISSNIRSTKNAGGSFSIHTTRTPVSAASASSRRLRYARMNIEKGHNAVQHLRSFIDAQVFYSEPLQLEYV